MPIYCQFCPFSDMLSDCLLMLEFVAQYVYLYLYNLRNNKKTLSCSLNLQVLLKLLLFTRACKCSQCCYYYLSWGFFAFICV